MSERKFDMGELLSNWIRSINHEKIDKDNRLKKEKRHTIYIAFGSAIAASVVGSIIIYILTKLL